MKICSQSTHVCTHRYLQLTFLTMCLFTAAVLEAFRVRY